MAICSRAFEGEADLRLMQALQQEFWRLEGARIRTHVGDLAWMSISVPRPLEWTRHLWLDGERCVAWAWVEGGASMEYDIHVDHRGGALYEEVLDWFELDVLSDGDRSVSWMEGDEVSLLLLQCRGYERGDDGGGYLYRARELVEEVVVLDVLDGFRLWTVRGEQDLRHRVLVHQVVWGLSRVMEEVYRDVMSIWPYWADLDCVVEVLDGGFVAYAFCWYDEANCVGEFEPVGTHQNYRRRGFGAAVCRYAFWCFCEEGGWEVIVYASARSDQWQVNALYESVGFRVHTRVFELRRTRT